MGVATVYVVSHLQYTGHTPKYTLLTKKLKNYIPGALVFTAHNGPKCITLHFRENEPVLNCLPYICMSLAMSLNTLLSNWAPL